MNRFRATTAVGIALGLVASGATAAPPATGPVVDPSAMIDNPQYTAWAKCSVGTSVTLVGETEAGGLGRVHVEVTQTLTAIAPEAVTLSHANAVTVSGQPQPAGPVTTQTIGAKIASIAMKLVGTADVTAMGRTYPCHVYEAAQPGVRGATKSTVYMNDSVPGGVVKLVAAAGGGASVTFLLASVSVK